jgi:hypothetical protein
MRGRVFCEKALSAPFPKAFIVPAWYGTFAYEAPYRPETVQ